MPEAGVQFRGVTVNRSGRPVIDGLSCTVPVAGVTALIGPNGAGKSLSLRLLAGLIQPDRGEIAFPGVRPRAQDLAIVFQDPVLLRRSVRGNLDHALAAYGVPRARRQAECARFLALGGLAELAARPARKLSGGEQQRLAMVRALAASPRFLLLDEPTASLDPQSTAAIEALIREAARNGVAVVLVTHDRGQAARLADQVLFLHQGRLVEHGPAGAFFANPASGEARAYLSGALLV